MTDELARIVGKVEDCLEAGRLLDAWALASGSGLPLARWPEGKPLELAARLADALGAPRCASALRLKNWRADRNDPLRYHMALFSRVKGATGFKYLAEIDEFIENHPGIEPCQKADLLAFKSQIHSTYCDFEPAERLINEALGLNPEDSWLHVQQARGLVAADRYPEALKAARRAVELMPVYRPAVTICAETLVHLGKDDEALELVKEAHRKSPQAAFALILQSYFSERRDHGNAIWCLDEIERLSPLMEPRMKRWLAGRRADFLLADGDMKGYSALAEQSESGFHRATLKQLRPEGQRVVLEVPFVRQHRMTCGPATLAAISAYWGRNHDHAEIAEAICYDGTPWHKERRWARDNGFLTREFRLTSDSLMMLIDRGVPFTLTTQWLTGAHLQACVGYDSRIGLVIVRDPTQRHHGEFLMSGLSVSHPVAGPRAMVMVPHERADLLHGIRLDDELLYDSLHELHVAIETHDRLKIHAALVGLQVVGRDHALVMDGGLRAAQKLEDWPRALELVEKLIELFPDHQSFWLTKSQVLRWLGRREERRRWLEEVVARPDGSDLVFSSELGELLLEDARELNRAETLLVRGLAGTSPDSRLLENLARCRMKQRRFLDAVVLRRAASCLSPSFEPYARGYFEICRICGRIADGLEFLESRTVEHGHKDHGPWITLAQSLELLKRSNDAAAVLDRGLQARPNDGFLSLHGGRLMTTWGPEFLEQGRKLMESARRSVPDDVWFWETAEVASFLGERDVAKKHLERLLERNPIHMDGWRLLARLVAEDEGGQRAVKMLREVLQRHSDSESLWGLLAEWQADAKGEAIPALDKLLQLNPRSIWGLRERSLRLLDIHRIEDALADAAEALGLDPLDPVSHYIRGVALKTAGRELEAAEEFRTAITLDVDHVGAIQELMALSPDRQSSLSSLDFIEHEMIRQVSRGPVVPAFQNAAWSWLDPDLLLSKLVHFCEQRPDLWETWSARIDHALKMGREQDALEASKEMTDMFPLLPRVWLDAAMVYRACGAGDKEVQATERALKLSPGWGEAARLHADALERNGDQKGTELLLRRAVDVDPLDGANHGYLADFLRRMGRCREAYDVLRDGLNRCPYYSWGWNTLAVWAKEDGRVSELTAVLEGMEACGHGRGGQLTLAESWSALGFGDKAIEILRLTLALRPDDTEVRVQLSRHLANSGRWDEAMEVCVIPNRVIQPRELEVRHAWVLMRQGHPVQAIQRMRALVEREPDYAWGLSEITSWLAARAEWKEVLEMATRWSRQAPNDARAHSYIGQARQALGDSNEAEKAFQRAYNLQPDHGFAGRQLLDLQMKAKHFVDAAETLRKLRCFAPSIWVECDAVELELTQGNIGSALNEAERLLEHPDAMFDVIHWLQSVFVEKGRENAWMLLLQRKVKDGSAVAPGALAAAIGQIPTASFAKTAHKLVTGAPLGSLRRIEAWKRMLELAAKLRMNDSIRIWISKHHSEFQNDISLWWAVGGALFTLGECARGAVWMRDWRGRIGSLTPDMLITVAGLNDGWKTKNDLSAKVAMEAREEAIRRFPNSQIASAFRGPLAFRLALNGEIKCAGELLDEFEAETISEFYANYGKLARAVIAAAEGDEPLARRTLQESSTYFASTHSVVAVSIVEQAIKSIASKISACNGSPRRLRKLWKLPQPSNPAPRQSSVQHDSTLTKILVVVFAAIFIAAIMIGQGSPHAAPFLIGLVVVSVLKWVNRESNL